MCTVLLNEKAVLGLVFEKQNLKELQENKTNIRINDNFFDDFGNFAFELLNGMPTFTFDSDNIIQKMLKDDEELSEYFYYAAGSIYPKNANNEVFNDYVKHNLLNNINYKWRDYFIKLMRIFLQFGK